VLGAFLDAVKDPSKGLLSAWTDPEVHVEGGRCKLLAGENLRGGGGTGAESKSEPYWKTSGKESMQSGFSRAIRNGRKNAADRAAKQRERVEAKRRKEEQKEEEETMRKNGLGKSPGLRAAQLHAWLSRHAAKGALGCDPAPFFPSAGTSTGAGPSSSSASSPALGGFSFKLDPCLREMPEKVFTNCVGFTGSIEALRCDEGGDLRVEPGPKLRFRAVVDFLVEIGLVNWVGREQQGAATAAAAAAGAAAAAAAASGQLKASHDPEKIARAVAVGGAKGGGKLAMLAARLEAKRKRDERDSGKTTAMPVALKQGPTPPSKEQPCPMTEENQRVYVFASPRLEVPEETECKGRVPNLKKVSPEFNLGRGEGVDSDQLCALWKALKRYNTVKPGSNGHREVDTSQSARAEQTRIAQLELFGVGILVNRFWKFTEDITKSNLGEWWEEGRPKRHRNGVIPSSPRGKRKKVRGK